MIVKQTKQQNRISLDSQIDNRKHLLIQINNELNQKQKLKELCVKLEL